MRRALAEFCTTQPIQYYAVNLLLIEERRGVPVSRSQSSSKGGKSTSGHGAGGGKGATRGAGAKQTHKKAHGDSVHVRGAKGAMANIGDGGDGGMAGPGGGGGGAGWKGQGPQGGASAAVPPKFAASLLMEEMEQMGDDMEGESCGRRWQVAVSVLTR